MRRGGGGGGVRKKFFQPRGVFFFCFVWGGNHLAGAQQGMRTGMTPRKAMQLVCFRGTEGSFHFSFPVDGGEIHFAPPKKPNGMMTSL